MSVTEDPCCSECPPSAKGRLVPAATVPFPPGRGPQARMGHAGAECAQDTWGREGETHRAGLGLASAATRLAFSASRRASDGRGLCPARLRGPTARATFSGNEAAGVRLSGRPEPGASAHRSLPFLAGSLESTEHTYVYKAQGAGVTPPQTPSGTRAKQRLPGTARLLS